MLDFETERGKLLAASRDEHVGLGIGTLGEFLQGTDRGVQDVIAGACQGAEMAILRQVRDSVPAFTRFLQDIHEFLLKNERDCFCTTYCIAHSMGNYLLRKSMEYLSDYLGTPVGRAMFNETVMLAPDLSSKDIELDGKGSYIGDFSRRVHVYYSRHDRALKASSTKRFGANRLGRHGAEDYQNIAPHIVLVNAEKYANSEAMSEGDLKDRRGDSVSVHSSHRYHPKILADIANVLSSIDRDLITTRIADRRLPSDSLMMENHYNLI